MTDWGNVPAGLALVGGLVAASAFVVGRLDARGALASRVFAVLTSVRIGLSREGTSPGSHVTVTPTNYGAAPIFDVGINLYRWGRRRWFWRFRKRAGWWTGGPVSGGGRVYSTIAPESEGAPAALPPPEGLPPPFATPQVIISFRDGNGRRWVRWPNGKLTSGWLTRRP